MGERKEGGRRGKEEGKGEKNMRELGGQDRAKQRESAKKKIFWLREPSLRR